MHEAGKNYIKNKLKTGIKEVEKMAKSEDVVAVFCDEKKNIFLK